MIYRKKKNKFKIFLLVLIGLILILIVFRIDIRAYIFGDRLKVLDTRQSEFFVDDDSVNDANVKKLTSVDENKGIMIFTKENSNINLEDLEKKFSGEEIIARLKKDADSFDGYTSDKNALGIIKKDTRLKILSHYNSSWYYVKPLESDEAVWVSEDTLRFPYTPRRKKDKLTDEELEVYINSKDIKVIGDKLLYVDIMRQSIYVFKDYSSKWDHYKTINCMSGSSRNTILKGQFDIVKKDDFVLNKSEKLSYSYLSKMSNSFDIRSIPKSTAPPKEIIEGEEETIITNSKKGNLWLDEADAKWIYDNVDLNTTIIIQ